MYISTYIVVFLYVNGMHSIILLSAVVLSQSKEGPHPSPHQLLLPLHVFKCT